MGYSINIWKYFNKYLIQADLLSRRELPKYGILNDDENYYQKEMLELGAQGFRGKQKVSLGVKVAKEYFDSIGIDCTSVDINGKYGSLNIDLREFIIEEWKNKFDIITNCGTTEHIYPIESQYQVFKNIHFCCKLNGIIIHFVPFGNRRHSHFYYGNKFFENIAQFNNYEIIEIEKFDRKGGDIYWGVCFRKTKDKEFMKNKNRFFENILEN